MSLLSKLKGEAKRMAEVKASRQSYDDVKWFKPETGDNLIRILPHWDPKKRKGDDFFFVKRVIHYLPAKKRDGTGTYKAPMVCPGEGCPACAVHSKLRKDKAKNAGDFKASERYLYNILSYGSGEDGPQFMVYGMPFTLHTEAMDWSEEIDCEYWDTKAGRDWKLKKTVDKSKGDMFGTKYKLIPKSNNSAIPSKLLEVMEDEITNLDEVWNDRSEEAMLEGLKLAGVGSDNEAPRKKSRAAVEEDEEETPRKKSRAVEEDEEEEEAPRKKSRAVVEEDEEEEAPRKKSRAAVEEEEAPRKKSRAVVEEDEEEEEEEEEEAPRKKSSAAEVSKKRSVEEDQPRSRAAKTTDEDADLEGELKRLGV